MNYEYYIAGIRVALDLPFEISAQPSSGAFLTGFAKVAEANYERVTYGDPAIDSLMNTVDDVSVTMMPTAEDSTNPISEQPVLASDFERPDMYFVCHSVPEFPSPLTGGHEENNRCYTETDTDEGVRKSVYFRPSPAGAPYACVTWRASEPQILSCDYLVGQEYQWNYSMKVCDMLGLESLLLHFDGLLLHSAFIRWQGQGILFSADSGVGKSTQADLWVKYQGAEILNGDRAGLRKLATGRPEKDDREDETAVWTACGLPYAGSSRVYRNESAPVAAIFMLEQAPFNEVKPLTPAQALRKLYPQITIHSWDANFVQRVLPLLEDFVTSVPVYLLRCLPDEGAVEVAKQELLKIRGRASKCL